MAFSESLASRTRDALANRRGVTEKKMFGGTCFLLNGNMVLGASWRHLMVRVGKHGHAAAVKRPGVKPMEMRGRVIEGYVKVDPSVLTDDAALEAWVKEAINHGRTLSAKAVKPGKIRKKNDDRLPLPPPLQRARAVKQPRAARRGRKKDS